MYIKQRTAQFVSVLRDYTSRDERRAKPAMKNNFGSLLLLLLLCLLTPISGRSQSTLAIMHASIIDVSGGPSQPDSTVLVSGDRITAIGSSAKIAVRERRAGFRCHRQISDSRSLGHARPS